MLLNSIISPLSSSPTSNFTKASPYSVTVTAHNLIPWRRSRKGAWTPRTLIKVSSSSSASESQTAVIVASQSQDEEAAEVVRRFYAGINGRELASVELLIAEKCVYEDLIFPRPFVGRKVAYPITMLSIPSMHMQVT